VPSAERETRLTRLPTILRVLEEAEGLSRLTLVELEDLYRALCAELSAGTTRGARRLRLRQWLVQVERESWGRSRYGWLRPAPTATWGSEGR
jgi:hypothetical protein